VVLRREFWIGRRTEVVALVGNRYSEFEKIGINYSKCVCLVKVGNDIVELEVTSFVWF